jgi:hypothetical protein
MCLDFTVSRQVFASLAALRNVASGSINRKPQDSLRLAPQLKTATLLCTSHTSSPQPESAIMNSTKTRLLDGVGPDDYMMSYITIAEHAAMLALITPLLV